MSTVCQSLSEVFCSELESRAQKAEESRIKQREEKKRCFISGAAEAQGAEVNVDFYT